MRRNLERDQARFSGDCIYKACTTRERDWKARGKERSCEGAAQIGDQGQEQKYCVRVCVSTQLLTGKVSCLELREFLCLNYSPTHPSTKRVGERG